MSERSTETPTSLFLHGEEGRLRWMSKVFMEAADPILIEDLDGNVIDMNLEAERAYGWTREELVGQPIRTIVPSERHDQANGLLDQCRRGRDVRNVEGLRQTRDGEVIQALITLSLLRDDQGGPVGIVSIAKDIGVQKKAEKELRMLSKVFMEAADPILIEDLDGNVINMNLEAERAYGWTRERLIGKPILVIVPVQCHDQARDLLQRCKSGEAVRNVEGLRQNKLGEERTVLLTLSLLSDDDGQPSGVASIAKDISEQKAAEKQLRSMSKVFMEAADPILIEDLSGQVIEMNDEAERSYGWSREELIGRPIRTLVPEAQHDQALELLALCKAGEDVRNVEGIRVTKEGEEIPVLLTLSMLRDDDNRPVGIASLAKDITAQKATEMQLRSMSKVFMEAADPILIEDLDGFVVEMNAETERSYSWPRDELLGEPITTIVPPSHHGQAGELLARCRAGEEVRNVEGVRQTRSGLEIPVLLTLSLLRDDDGLPVGIASLAKDISQQKATERELQEYRDHLEVEVAKRTQELEVANERLADAQQSANDANRAKSSFLANMSHELRTPMNAIIGYSEMLMEEAQDMDLDTFTPDLERIHGAGRHLLALINDILDLSKIEAGRMDLFLETFDVDGLIDDVASTVDSLMQKNRNILVVERGRALGSVRADQTKVRQMIFNLISNAAKFTQAGTITLSARRGTDAEDGWITYAVADSGIGIPDDKIACLFDEFSQVDASTTRDYGGTGLGLAITKRFCEMMGGTIGVKSEPGVGSTFTIRLPVEVREAVESEPAGEPHAPSEGSCVLVIDDDADSRELIRRSLLRDGAQVAVASSGDEGLRLARELRPALITLDVLMPGKDGWAVLRELKADPELREIPVVMISMVDGSDMGFALGATDYLAKPVEREQLRALLRRHGVAQSGRVLVVDDDAGTRSILRRILEQEECTVVEAVHGREALDEVSRRKPDLILLDLMMPVMDGFEFTTELRKVDEWRDIPVIVSTAKDVTPEERADLSGAVEGILQKNARGLDDLMAQVRSLLPERQAAAFDA